MPITSKDIMGRAQAQLDQKLQYVRNRTIGRKRWAFIASDVLEDWVIKQEADVLAAAAGLPDTKPMPLPWDFLQPVDKTQIAGNPVRARQAAAFFSRPEGTPVRERVREFDGGIIIYAVWMDATIAIPHEEPVFGEDKTPAEATDDGDIVTLPAEPAEPAEPEDTE